MPEVDEQGEYTGSKPDGEVLVQALRVTVENDAVGYVGSKEEVDVQFAVILVLTLAFGEGDVRCLRVDRQEIEEGDPVADDDMLAVMVKRRALDLLLCRRQAREEMLVVEDELAHVADERLKDVRVQPACVADEQRVDIPAVDHVARHLS